MPASSPALWLGAHYEEQYQRKGESWLINRLKLHIKQFSPYETGFGQTRIADINV